MTCTVHIMGLNDNIMGLMMSVVLPSNENQLELRHNSLSSLVASVCSVRFHTASLTLHTFCIWFVRA